MRVQVLIEVEAEKLFNGGIKNLNDWDFTIIEINSVKPLADPLFRVEFTACGEKGIQVIKTIREHTGLGLKEAKDLFDNTRNANTSIIKEGLGEVEAKLLQRALEAAGGSARIVKY